MSDWRRVDAQTDDDIRRAIVTDPDAAPEVDVAWFKSARIVMPEPKQSVSLRLDREVMEWFKKRGRGYQTRINAVLRAYVSSHGEDPASPPAAPPPHR
jgi:uncharacterized protein (DUF4415 family)